MFGPVLPPQRVGSLSPSEPRATDRHAQRRRLELMAFSED